MSHDHDHSHAPKNFSRAFVVSIALNTGFVIVEVSYGILANSLALIADAGLILVILGLLMAWCGAYPRTFGDRFLPEVCHELPDRFDQEKNPHNLSRKS